MKKLLFLLLSAAVTVSVTGGITRTSNHQKNTSHKATTTKLAKTTRATGAVTPMVPGQFHGWNNQVSHALRSDHAITWDFEDENQFNDFNCIDNDGDGFNWYYITNAGHEWEEWFYYETHSGDGIVCSKSYYQEDHRDLTPDNWLISPRMILGSTLSFFAVGQSDDVFSEKCGVYVCVGTPTGVEDFVQLGDDFTTTDEFQEFVVDLSAYEGQVGHFAIVHHNVSGQFILNIDDITTDGNILPPPETPDVKVTPRSTTAVVEWDAGEGELKWNLRYRLWRDILANPIDCNFNDENYDLEKAGWTLDDADGDGRNWRVDNGHLYSESYDPVDEVGFDPDNYLYSPEIKLQGILRFTYWGLPDWYGEPYSDTFMVYAQVGEEMHPLAAQDYVTSTDHLTETIDLNQFGGQVGRIVFRHYNCENEYALCLDDIFIGNPDAELIEPAEWTEVKALTTPNYTIKGLTLKTRYEVQVLAYNVVNQSDWSKIVDFTTLEDGADVFELGDVNHDSEVSIDDVTCLIGYLLGNNDIFEEQADTYGDNTIDIADVTSLITFVLSGYWPDVEHVYTVVGTPNLFEGYWDIENVFNNMVKGEDGIYRLSKGGFFQAGDQAEFKIVQDHDFAHSWPAEGNALIVFPETGVYNVGIAFNPKATDEMDIIRVSLDMLPNN